LNPTDPVLDKKWVLVAKRQQEELRSGRIEPVLTWYSKIFGADSVHK